MLASCAAKQLTEKREMAALILYAQILINNDHILVNLESCDDILCGPPTTTWETMQFIRLQIK